MNPRGVAVLTALPAAPTSPSHGKPADVSKGSAKVTLLSGAENRKPPWPLGGEIGDGPLGTCSL